MEKDKLSLESFCLHSAAIGPRPATEKIDALKTVGTEKHAKQMTVFSLGFLFAVDQNQSQYVWVKCHQTVFEGNVDEIADLSDLLGDIFITREVTMGATGNKQVVEVFFKANFFEEGSKSNRCVSNNLQRESSASTGKRDWRGPIVVLRHSYNTNGDQPFGGVYQGVTPEDGRVAQMYLGKHGPHRLLSDLVPAKTSPTKQKAVIINCEGYQKFSKKPKYIETITSQNQQLFNKGTISEISEHLGIPLYLQKHYTLPRQWARHQIQGFNPFKNTEPWDLLLETSTKTDVKNWGWGSVSGEEWDIEKMGSVLIYRKDGKDLTTRQVEVLVAFCRDEVLPAMKPLASTVFDEGHQKNFVENDICREMFHKFFAEYEKKTVGKVDQS